MLWGYLTTNSRETTAFLGGKRFIRIADYAAFYARYEDRLVPVFSYTWRSKETWMYEIDDRR